MRETLGQSDIDIGSEKLTCSVIFLSPCTISGFPTNSGVMSPDPSGAVGETRVCCLKSTKFKSIQIFMCRWIDR